MKHSMTVTEMKKYLSRLEEDGYGNYEIKVASADSDNGYTTDVYTDIDYRDQTVVIADKEISY